MNAVKNFGNAFGGFAFVRKAIGLASEKDERDELGNCQERLEPCYCDRNVFNVLH